MIRKLMMIGVACLMMAGPAAAHGTSGKDTSWKKCHKGGDGVIPEINPLAGLAALGGLGAALMMMHERHRRH